MERIYLKVVSPLNAEQASYARDSFAKSIYERVFNWVVVTTNKALQSDQKLGVPVFSDNKVI